ncbi:MAG: helix-turn-helix domain-containing protein [Desulfomicrobium sp.]
MFTNEVKLFCEKEAADFLSISVKTLQQWRYLKKPPVYIKFGRNVRYKSDDLVKYIEACIVEPMR